MRLGLKGRYVADYFAGSSRVSAAIRRMGFTSRDYDIVKGPSGDLTSPTVLQSIERDATSNRIISAMLGPPCTSFSIARNRTSVIRTAEEPWGITTRALNEREQTAIDNGNKTTRATIRILRVLNRARVPWILENPASSRMWHIPELQRACRRASGHFRCTDFCGWGARWRKRTLLMIGNMEPADTEHLSRHCVANGKLCGFSHKPHFVLSGSDKNGTPYTRIAQPYPTKFANAVAKTLLVYEFPAVTYNS